MHLHCHNIPATFKNCGILETETFLQGYRNSTNPREKDHDKKRIDYSMSVESGNRKMDKKEKGAIKPPFPLSNCVCK